MKFMVILTEDAVRDLEELFDYIATYDSKVAALHVLDGIEKSFNRLESFPNRGSYPGELLTFGIKEYREISFKPYRIFYRVSGESVHIYLITDGRRDMQTLLMKRLLGA